MYRFVFNEIPNTEQLKKYPDMEQSYKTLKYVYFTLW